MHTVVVEATYGTSSHEKRNSREQRLVDKVRSIVARGGRCLMPVVALGRAQVCSHCIQHRSTAWFCVNAPTKPTDRCGDPERAHAEQPVRQMRC